MSLTKKQNETLANMYSIGYKEIKLDDLKKMLVGSNIKDLRQDKKTTEIALVTDKGTIMFGPYTEAGEGYISIGKV